MEFVVAHKWTFKLWMYKWKSFRCELRKQISATDKTLSSVHTLDLFWFAKTKNIAMQNVLSLYHISSGMLLSKKNPWIMRKKKTISFLLKLNNNWFWKKSFMHRVIMVYRDSERILILCHSITLAVCLFVHLSAGHCWV